MMELAMNPELVLHRSSELKPEQYCDWVLESLSKDIPYLYARWAIRTPTGDGEFLASKGIDQKRFLETYPPVARYDPLPAMMSESHGGAITINFMESDSSIHGNYIQWVNDFSFQKALAIQMSQDYSKTQQGIAMFRTNSNPDYSDNEVDSLNKLAPYIFKGLRIGREAEIKRELFNKWSAENYICTTTQSGTILDMEDNFYQCIHNVWPDWEGPYLPREMQSLAVRGEQVKKYRKKNILIRAIAHGESYVLLLLKDIGTLGRLTNTEFRIAEMYADGIVTTEIAKTLSRSVHTIENHRKNIYKKLEIDSSVKLTNIFSSIEKH